MPKTIKLSNMGEQALKSHMKAKYHIKNAEAIQLFFLDQQRKKMTMKENVISTVYMPKKRRFCLLSSLLFQISQRILSMLWVRYSSACLLIAKDFQLSRTKLTYITKFAPYFHQLLIDELRNCNYYSPCFNESLNSFMQTCKMDINIPFWSKD